MKELEINYRPYFLIILFTFLCFHLYGQSDDCDCEVIVRAWEHYYQLGDVEPALLLIFK